MKKIKVSSNTILKITASIALLMIASALSYYYALYLPKKNEQKMEIEAQEREEEKRKEEEAESEADLNDTMRDLCIEWADDAYWEYMELNGTKKTDGTIYADQRFWDNARDTKNDAIDECYREYPN